LEKDRRLKSLGEDRTHRRLFSDRTAYSCPSSPRKPLSGGSEQYIAYPSSATSWMCLENRFIGCTNPTPSITKVTPPRPSTFGAMEIDTTATTRNNTSSSIYLPAAGDYSKKNDKTKPSASCNLPYDNECPPLFLDRFDELPIYPDSINGDGNTLLNLSFLDLVPMSLGFDGIISEPDDVGYPNVCDFML